MAVAISLNITSKALNIPQHQQLTATVTGGSAGQTWSSTNASIASVSGSGLVTAVATGTCTITATSTADGSKTATCAITVVASSSIHMSNRSNNYIQSLLQDRLELIRADITHTAELAVVQQALADIRSFGND